MKNSLFALLALLLTMSVAVAQRVVTGTVVDAKNNESLVGANIVIPGTTTGTVADVNGKFTLTLPASATAIQVSFIGYLAQTVPVGNASNVTVSLVAGGELAEVVVLGYTTSRKQDLTGAVAIVDIATVNKTSTGNPMQALQGRVPGLYIEKTGTPSGDASRILIRGANTLGNTDPLYIIDGVPTKVSQVFQSLNPSTIQSIQVLKDASSASIYGSRASNGVIIVTTKNGANTDGKLNVQFNTSITAQSEKSQRYKLLNAADRGRALWQASVNDGVDPADGFGQIYNFDWNRDFRNPRLNNVTVRPFVGGDQNVPVGDTDWQSVMYQTGVITNNDLSISGGTKNSSLLINVGHLNNTGMLRYTGYNRLTGRINGLTSKFDGRFKLGVNLQLVTSKEVPTATDLGGSPTPSLAISLAPTIPVYDKNGEFAGPIGAGYSDRNNPLYMQYLNRWDKIDRNIVFGNIFTEIEPIRGLIFRSSLGLNSTSYYNKNIEQSFQNGFIARPLNSLTINTSRFMSLTWTNTLRYNFDLGAHRFNVLAGVESIRDNQNDIISYRENFAVQTEDFFVLSAASGNASSNGSSTGSRLLSQFARVDYGFGDRYLASVTLRRDGSSRFGPENRYGFFPAAAIGWRIDREGFMQNVKAISTLKLRAGVGRIGNQDIGDLARFGLFEPRYGLLASQVPNGHQPFFDQFAQVGTAYDINGAKTGTLPSGFVQTQGANDALKWETTDELNVGLDFAFLNGSLAGSFDYFTRQTSGILIKPPVASAVGEGQLRFINGATKTNKGFELNLSYFGKPVGNFTYSVSTNFARFRDKVTVLPEEVRSAYAGNGVTTIIGRSQLDLFGYVADGIFQSQEEVNNAPRQPGAGPGRIRYKDLNGDNKIDPLDQEFFGTSLPGLEYGINVNLGFKNFDFSLFGSGIAGRTGFDNYIFVNNFIRGRENVGPGVFDAWTPQNTTSTIPALTLADVNNETRSSTYFNVNTSYFKIRNIQLGYTLPKDVIGKVGLSALRLYGMVENVFWLKSKSFSGPDPERVDISSIPVPRSFTFGLNVSF